MPRQTGNHDKWVTAIGIAKLTKGLLLAAVGVGALKLLHQDAAEKLTQWIQHFNVDPNGHYFRLLINKVSGLDTKKMLWGALATFTYAALFLTEGIGLLLEKVWAEYFTVIVTSSFLPLEIYELVKEMSAFKVAVTIANVAIVAYLIWRLKCKKKQKG